MTASLLESFAGDPISSHSAQFPLGRFREVADLSVPSAPGVRPWGLGGMRPARHQGNPVQEAFTYDHDRQVAVSQTGVPLTITAATANKVTNNDGDEGPSEDFTYDYCPDSPFAA